MSYEKQKKGFWGLFRSKSSAVRNGKLVSDNTKVPLPEAPSINAKAREKNHRGDSVKEDEGHQRFHRLLGTMTGTVTGIPSLAHGEELVVQTRALQRERDENYPTTGSMGPVRSQNGRRRGFPAETSCPWGGQWSSYRAASRPSGGTSGLYLTSQTTTTLCLPRQLATKGTAQTLQTNTTL